jgi:hypothetical protein
MIVLQGVTMRKLISDDTLDIIKYFSVVIGVVALLLIIYNFGMSFIQSQYRPPYLVIDSPDRNYTARVYKTAKKEGITISVYLYDKMSRVYRKNIYVQAYCDKVELSWRTMDALIINKTTMNIKSPAVKFTKKDETFCPISSVLN